jgi:phospholipid/cholesterol/gamma-HCH transport system substrate-binding protein
MKYKTNEIKAGMMIVVSISILAIFLIAIFGMNVGEETKAYSVYLAYVGGISKGSLVKYMGMDVGQVTGITLPQGEESRILIKLRVKSNTPVRIDSKAYVTSVGIMSDQHIEITPGSVSAALLPTNSIIESKEVMGFAQMSQELGELNNQLQDLIGKVSDVLNDQNRSHIASIMTHADSIIQDQREPLLKTMNNLENLSSQLNGISKNVDELMASHRTNFDEILSNLKTTVEKSNQLIGDLGGSAAHLELLLSTNNQNITETLENFQNTSRNLEDFTRIIKEQPWLLVRKAAPPERKY